MKDDRWCILEFSTTPEPNTGSRHCEERSYEAIHKPRKAAGLLRFARNDGLSSEAPLLSLAFGAEFLARLAVQALGVGFRRTFLGLCLFGFVRNRGWLGCCRLGECRRSGGKSKQARQGPAKRSFHFKSLDTSKRYSRESVNWSSLKPRSQAK
jgi:hypothetical protein